MHIRTMNSAELNGHVFADGTILDLPKSEASLLIEREMAEPLGAEESSEEEGEAGSATAQRKRKAK